jgi:hypothetical protein
MFLTKMSDLRIAVLCVLIAIPHLQGVLGELQVGNAERLWKVLASAE